MVFCIECAVNQWRNSYGLRVGKPAGTRAEGAPAGCPFTLVFQLRLPFQKGAPLLSSTFFIMWLLNSINWWNQNHLSAPRAYNLCRGGGGLHIWIFKKVPLFNTFFIVRSRNSHNDACHKLMKSEIFGCPHKCRGGGTSYVRYMGMWRPNNHVDFTHKKIGKGWSYFDPSPKRIPKHGSNG